MQLVLCVHAGTTQLNVVWPTYASIVLKIFSSVNTGDFTSELHELGNQDLDSECED